VLRCCALLGISRSRYYRWQAGKDAPPSPRQQEREEVAWRIAFLFHAHRERPGRRPMQHLLAAQGVHASLGRIDRLMRALGLQARRGRSRRQTPRSGPSPALTAHITNHCLDADGNRTFTSTAPGHQTVGDITRILTAEEPCYLATVIDQATRRVVGWATATTQDTALTSSALTDARTRELLARSAIFHSDRGTQYTSHPFQAQCAALEVTQSMGATGVCWDNAVAESFFATLKGDLRSELPGTPPTAVLLVWLHTWIEDWYNDRRPHSTNGGLPPTVAWEQHYQKDAVP
jgi:transposase InsO family protein